MGSTDGPSLSRIEQDNGRESIQQVPGHPVTFRRLAVGGPHALPGSRAEWSTARLLGDVADHHRPGPDNAPGSDFGAIYQKHALGQLNAPVERLT